MVKILVLTPSYAPPSWYVDDCEAVEGWSSSTSPVSEWHHSQNCLHRQLLRTRKLLNLNFLLYFWWKINSVRLLLVSHLAAHKPSLLLGWAERPHRCPSVWWHICQPQLDLKYWSGISNWHCCLNNLTCDIYTLPISCRSSKVSKGRTPREHLIGRSRKLVWDADVNVFRTVSTAIFSIEDLHSVDSDRSTVVDGKPWRRFVFCVTHVLISHRLSLYISVNALGCY